MKLIAILIFSILSIQSSFAQGQRVISIEKGNFQSDINATVYFAKLLVCGVYPSVGIRVVGQLEDIVLISVVPATVSCRAGEAPRVVSFDISNVDAILESMNIDPRTTDIFFNLQ
jgi:hypothetical protein